MAEPQKRTRIGAKGAAALTGPPQTEALAAEHSGAPAAAASRTLPAASPSISIPPAPSGAPIPPSTATAPDEEIVRRLANPEAFGGVVAVSKDIIGRLRAAGLAQDAILTPGMLGLHPSNRGHYGANEESVHNLGADIAAVGWDFDQVTGGLCVEEDPSDRYVAAYNEELCADSDFLAPADIMHMRAGTLTNGHTVLFLRALVAGVPCSLPGVSIDGRMSLAHVSAKDPAMARAALEGWRWTVLHHSTRRAYPGLFEFLSEARNVNLQRTEGEVQVLLKAYNVATEYLRRKQPISWETVAKV